MERTCLECNKTFVHRQSLWRHRRDAHVAKFDKIPFSISYNNFYNERRKRNRSESNEETCHGVPTEPSIDTEPSNNIDASPREQDVFETDSDSEESQEYVCNPDKVMHEGTGKPDVFSKRFKCNLVPGSSENADNNNNSSDEDDDNDISGYETDKVEKDDIKMDGDTDETEGDDDDSYVIGDDYDNYSSDDDDQDPDDDYEQDYSDEESGDPGGHATCRHNECEMVVTIRWPVCKSYRIVTSWVFWGDEPKIKKHLRWLNHLHIVDPSDMMLSIKKASDDRIATFEEIVHNIFYSKIPIEKKDFCLLRQERRSLTSLADADFSIKTKRRIILKRGENFVELILRCIVPLIVFNIPRKLKSSMYEKVWTKDEEEREEGGEEEYDESDFEEMDDVLQGGHGVFGSERFVRERVRSPSRSFPRGCPYPSYFLNQALNIPHELLGTEFRPTVPRDKELITPQYVVPGTR